MGLKKKRQKALITSVIPLQLQRFTMDDKKGGNGMFLFVSVVAVNLASFTMGTGFGWTSPSVPKLNGFEDAELGDPITSTEELFLGSLIAIGGIFSPPLSGIAADAIGRKWTLLAFTVPILVSYLIVAFARDIWWFFVARFLAGFSAGTYYAVIPNYVAEISEVSNRGAYSCFQAVNVPLGVLITYAVGPFLNLQNSSFVYLVAPILFFILFGFFIPESPYFLLTKNMDVEAREALAKLRGKRKEDVEKELIEMSDTLRESNSSTSIRELLKSKVLVKGLSITLGLVFFQQFSGINVLLFYMQTIFEATGSAMPGQHSSMIIAAVQISGALLTSAVVDKLGRRLLLIVSCIGTTVSLIALGAFFHLKDDDQDVSQLGWLPIVSLIAYMISYGVGLGPVAFTVLGEIFPQNAKATASTLTISICFFLTFVTTALFPYLMDVIGKAFTFYIIAAFCFCGLFFVYFVVPETKGKTFSEIQKMIGA